MVNSTTFKICLLVCLSLISCFSLANDQLTASVDRNKIYEMDTLNLTVQGQIKMDSVLGGLMNLSLSQMAPPDTTELEKDFDILDRHQSYNMQSFNGDSTAKVAWRYTLSPKSVGVLEIPAILYKEAKTKPISITVIEGNTPKNTTEPPAIFIEVETDKAEAYVQEQVIYTLRLYTQGLVNGELSSPTSTDAIIEPFGEQKKFYRMVHNQRYDVIERQFLIYPQKSGLLSIDKQTFQGISLKHGRRTRVQDISDTVELTIKPPASSFTGKNWLPATSLFLNESWQGNPDLLQVGDSLTRKIELSALGLLGSALPPATMPESNLYKLYADKPQTESMLHESGAQAKRIDSFALVAIKEGEIQLDEIKIPWWDTVNDVERIATIPARTLAIMANPDAIQTPPSQENVQPLKQEKANSTDMSTKPEALESIEPKQSNTQHLWQTISASIFILWVITMLYLVKQNRQLTAQLLAVPTPKQQAGPEEKTLFNEALSSIKENNSSIPRAVLAWLNVSQQNKDNGFVFTSIQDINQVSPAIYQHLTVYEEGLYSGISENYFNKQALIDELKTLRQQYVAQAKNNTGNSTLKAKTLMPFQ